MRDLSREFFHFRQKVTLVSLLGENCTMELPEEGKYAVGFLFLPPDIVERENVQRHFLMFILGAVLVVVLLLFYCSILQLKIVAKAVCKYYNRSEGMGQKEKLGGNY